MEEKGKLFGISRAPYDLADDDHMIASVGLVTRLA